MGEAAASAVGEMQQNISTLANSVSNAHQKIDGQTQDHGMLFDYLAKQIAEVRTELLTLNLTLANEKLPRENTFWGRVRWVVTGR
jgi:uncharacterized protein YqfA (UPF0365 family)